MKYFHSISGFPLANNSFIDHVTEAIERILSHKTSKKFSLKVEDLKSATNWLDSKQIVKYLRTKVIIISLFVLFWVSARISEDLILNYFRITLWFSSKKARLTLAEMDTGCVLHVFESELCPIRSGISPKSKYCKGGSRHKNWCKARVFSFLIRYFSNYYTLHRSDLTARAAPLDPRLYWWLFKRIHF